MEIKPEVSIIIPVYNTSIYLEKCLYSIINQSFKKIEIICIDDGSIDDSLMLLKKIAEQDNRISIIHRDRASGSAALPRNIGLRAAKGKYIMFLDSDDYFDLYMIEKLYLCAEKEQADLVMCDNYIVSSIDGNVKNYEGELHHKYITKTRGFSYKDIPNTIFQISNAAVWHKLILRDVIIRNQLEFVENIPVLDDIYFVNLLLMLSSTIYILDEKLVYYRKLRPGAQTTLITKYKESIFEVFNKLNIYLIENNLYNEVKKSLQNWILDTMCWWFYSIKDYDSAIEMFYLYKNVYFERLGLMDMCELDIYHHKMFYNYILYEEYRPSIDVLLNSISSDGINIILYGAGKLGKEIYADINNKQIHTIKLWCDINADNMKNPLVCNPEKIKDFEYDAVIIAIADETIIMDVKKYLNNLGIDENKVYSL